MPGRSSPGNPPAASDEPGLLDVLLADQPAEVGVGVVAVERELGQLANRRDRVEGLDVDALLDDADVLVGALQRRHVQRLLGPEVVVDHALGGPRLAGDLVDPGAGEAAVGELLGGDVQDLLAGALRVALATRSLGRLLLHCHRRPTTPGRGMLASPVAPRQRHAAHPIHPSSPLAIG